MGHFQAFQLKWHDFNSAVSIKLVAMNILPSVSYNEDELVLFLQNKDQSIFNYLYKNYAAALYGVINKMVGDDHTSEDVLQDVFVKIWGRIDQYDPKKGRICTWMISIARNAAIDVLRSKGDIMKHKIQPEESMFHMSAKPDQTDAIGIRTLVSKLRPECMVVLELVYYKGYTTVDVANTLCLPEGTVKTRLRQGIKILRKNFQHVAVA